MHRIALLALSAVVASGCQTRTQKVPSVSENQGHVNYAQRDTVAAQKANAENVALYRHARTKAERIEHKAVLIGRYWQ
jgi:hypothetical protein